MSNPRTTQGGAEAHMTTGEAARVLGVSPDRVRQLAKTGRLPIGRRSVGSTRMTPS
jgi:excisionase family DNA binding protein